MSVSIHPLYEGTFSVGTDTIFHPIATTDRPHRGALKVSIHPCLIKSEDRNILFDAGIADLFGGETSIQTMYKNLEKQNLSNLDITDIFVSHLHFDHFAGVANRDNGFWELTFPNATLRVSEGDWKELTENASELDEDRQEFLFFLEARADIEFLEEDTYTIPGVRSITVGGHSKYHQIHFFEQGEHKYLMAGDIIEGRSSINQNYAAKYDFDPPATKEIRDKLQKTAFEEGYTILAYHETQHPVFRLSVHDRSAGKFNPVCRELKMGDQNLHGGQKAQFRPRGVLLLLKVNILNFVTGLLVVIGKTEDGVLSLVIGQDGVALFERRLL